MSGPLASGYAPVNGVEMYWERHGAGGTPLVVVHGGFGVVSMIKALVEKLAQTREVLGVELQGHGHTRDIDRPFSYEAFGDDVAGLVRHLGYSQADLLGYSLGAGACLRAAVQHPDLVRKLAVVSFPYQRDGWYAEVRAAFDHMSSDLLDQLRHSPLYAAYAAVAPNPDGFPGLMDKTGELQRQPYDWGQEVRGLRAQTLLVYADADSVPASHIAEFYALLGGGLRDAGWDGSSRPVAQLAVLPGRTHYDIFESTELEDVAERFFSCG